VVNMALLPRIPMLPVPLKTYSKALAASSTSFSASSAYKRKGEASAGAAAASASQSQVSSMLGSAANSATSAIFGLSSRISSVFAANAGATGKH
jgi:hypothetical protein